MNNLDVYKNRKHSVVTLGDKEYKIPAEFTVEEAERMLEMEVRRKEIEKQGVDDEKKQLQEFWSIVFDQLELLFQHHQPEITSAELRRLITHKEALEIVGFYNSYRHIKPTSSGDSKKKILKAN